MDKRDLCWLVSMKDYYKLDLDDVFKELESSEEGLSKEEVEKKILKYGKNILP